MNGYELADELEAGHTASQELRDETANMLRQQADRIADLEKQSEPVAWISIDVEQGKTIGFEKKQWAEIHIPLYTTPQTKPLSDEEIDKIIYSVDWAYNPVLLARAIEERHGIK